MKPNKHDCYREKEKEWRQDGSKTFKISPVIWF